jgi:hypothetical protein
MRLTVDGLLNARDEVFVADDREQDEEVKRDENVAQGGAVLALAAGEEIAREVQDRGRRAVEFAGVVRLDQRHLPQQPSLSNRCRTPRR